MVTEKRVVYADVAVHPGEVLAEELETRGVTQRAFAEALGRPEQAISEIVRGKKAITAETALQLADYLGTSAELWMNLQTAYSLSVARRAASMPLKKVAERAKTRYAASKRGKRR